MRYLLSFLLALACLTSSAQQLIFGSVRDGILKEQFATPSTTSQYNANDFLHRETQGNIHLVWAKGITNNLSLEVQDR